MLDYETYLRIHHLHDNEKLRAGQIAGRLRLHPDTVSKWLGLKHYPKRQSAVRASKLDPYKKQIGLWLEAYPYSATQIIQKLQEIGYDGGRTILKDYLRSIRPRKQSTYLKLRFEPGECAQVDWGECGIISVGKARRKLQVFVMVMCYSRMLFLRFYHSQSMECFLDAHVRAFEFFGGVPRRLMIDNLKTGVIEHRCGQLPEYHPRYLDLARHYGFAPVACNVAKGNEKGRVERGVGYIKDNFLGGRQISTVESLQAAADQWRDQIANKRIHGTTNEPPSQRFQEEKAVLIFLRPEPYDCAVTKRAFLHKDGRVRFDNNTYTLPPGQTTRQLTLKIEAERIRIYHELDAPPIASHKRCYDRLEDIEDPAHTEQLKEQRRRAREQNLTHDFRKLGASAVHYYEQLKERHLDYRAQLRRLMALVKIYGEEKVCRALQDALEEEAIHAAYIEKLLSCRELMMPEASPLHLTRNEDQLELTSPQPDLEIYTKPRRPKQR